MPNVTAPLAVSRSSSRRCARASEATSAGWPDGYAAMFFQAIASARTSSSTCAPEGCGIVPHRPAQSRSSAYKAHVFCTVERSRATVTPEQGQTGQHVEEADGVAGEHDLRPQPGGGVGGGEQDPQLRPPERPVGDLERPAAAGGQRDVHGEKQVGHEQGHGQPGRRSSPRRPGPGAGRGRRTRRPCGRRRSRSGAAAGRGSGRACRPGCRPASSGRGRRSRPGAGRASARRARRRRRRASMATRPSAVRWSGPMAAGTRAARKQQQRGARRSAVRLLSSRRRLVRTAVVMTVGPFRGRSRPQEGDYRSRPAPPRAPPKAIPRDIQAHRRGDSDHPERPAHLREGRHRLVDVGGRVGGRDLDADAREPARHHREEEPLHVDPFLQERASRTAAPGARRRGRSART